MYKKNSKKFSAGTEFKKQIKKRDLVESGGGTSESSAEGTKHSYSEAEKVAFVDWINTSLQDDPLVKSYLPINPSTSDIFQKIQDGIILWCVGQVLLFSFHLCVHPLITSLLLV